MQNVLIIQKTKRSLFKTCAAFAVLGTTVTLQKQRNLETGFVPAPLYWTEAESQRLNELMFYLHIYKIVTMVTALNKTNIHEITFLVKCILLLLIFLLFSTFVF